MMKQLLAIYTNSVALVGTVLIMFMIYGYVLVLPAEAMPVAEPMQYDSDIKRMVFAECLKRIQSVKDLDQWYESAHECGEIARWESSI